jgi:hyperosmotically inducible periplasmic protein
MHSVSRLCRRFAPTALFIACAVLAGSDLRAQQQPPAPDNTKVNTRDRKPTAVKADQQKNNKTDLETTRQIRKALVADKSLSTYAHNGKVVTQNGKVTLKGPVRSEDEKKAVEAKAAEVAGAGNVTNQISIAKTKAKKDA